MIFIKGFEMEIHGVSIYTTQQMVIISPCLTDKKEIDSS